MKLLHYCIATAIHYTPRNNISNLLSDIDIILMSTSLSGPVRSGCDSKTATYNLVLLNGNFIHSYGNALRWVFTND